MNRKKFLESAPKKFSEINPKSNAFMLSQPALQKKNIKLTAKSFSNQPQKNYLKSSQKETHSCGCSPKEKPAIGFFAVGHRKKKKI